MMDVSRRGFFRLTAGAAALAAMPATVRAVATIYGDGVHDDGPGLSALIRGEVVEILNPEAAEGTGWNGDTLLLCGHFTLQTPVEIGEDFSRKALLCSGSTFRAAPDLDGNFPNAMIHLSISAFGVSIQGVHLIAGGDATPIFIVRTASGSA